MYLDKLDQGNSYIKCSHAISLWNLQAPWQRGNNKPAAWESIL